MRYALLLFAALASPVLAAERTFPAETGNPVIDAANIIPDDAERMLNEQIYQIQRDTKHQVAVLTLPTLGGADLNEYSIDAARHYGFGNRERSDGVLWTIIPSERKDRIEVGDGLQGVLTDAESSRIRRSIVLPLFKAGDIVGGIEAGVDAIGTTIAAEPVTQQQIVATQERKSAETGSAFLTVLLSIVAVAAGALGVGFLLSRREEKRRKTQEAEDAAQAVRLATMRAAREAEDREAAAKRREESLLRERTEEAGRDLQRRQRERERARENIFDRADSQPRRQPTRTPKPSRSYSPPPPPPSRPRPVPTPSPSPVTYVPVVDPEPYRYSSPPPPPPPPSPSFDFGSFGGDGGSFSGGGSGGSWD